MNSSDNIVSLIYLKKKLQKWKNIAILIAIFSLILLFKLFFGVNSNVIDSDFVAVIKIEGIITEDSTRSKILKEITKQDSIKAVVVRINSPGGTIVGSEILFNELTEIKKNKPLIVLIDSVGASGAYMASLASDYIFVHNGTITGSIGVLLESYEFTDLAKKIGVTFNSYKSSPLKGSPSIFEKNNPQVNKVINESIQDSYNFFVELVKTRRGNKIDPKFYSTIFDGRIFTGRQALNYGLVDFIGGISEVEKLLLLQKINTDKIPLKEIETNKKERHFFQKLLNLLPFYNSVKNKFFENKIMAVMS